jgi:hypothetical protein
MKRSIRNEKNEVAKAWERIKIFLQQIYGEGGNVNVKFCSSWRPEVNPYLKNGQPRLFSKQVAVENIAGRPVALFQPIREQHTRQRCILRKNIRKHS